MSLDKTIHDFDRRRTTIPWKDFHSVGVDEGYYDFYYAEERLYIIRDRITNQLFFVEAKSPAIALTALKENFHNVDLAMAGKEADG